MKRGVVFVVVFVFLAASIFYYFYSNQLSFSPPELQPTTQPFDCSGMLDLCIEYQTLCTESFEDSLHLAESCVTMSDQCNSNRKNCVNIQNVVERNRCFVSTRAICETASDVCSDYERISKVSGELCKKMDETCSFYDFVCNGGEPPTGGRRA